MHRKEYIGVVFESRDHMARLHRAYYSQFVTDEIKHLVLRGITRPKIEQSIDHPSFNDIPLSEWDALVPKLPRSVEDQLREHGDYLTMAGGVCILKEAARQIREST